MHPILLLFQSETGLLTGNSPSLYDHADGLVHWVSIFHLSGEDGYTNKVPRSIVGPMIGGALARPCISYPELFPRGTIWDRYPYLLPNLFSAATVFVGVIIGILFLEETHVAKKTERDRGREIGDYITSKIGSISSCSSRERAPEKQSLLGGHRHLGDDCSDDETLPEYRSQENSPKLVPQADPEPVETVPHQVPGSPGFKIFTRPVIMNIISYGILAL